MRTISTVAEAVDWRRAAPSPVVLVPTMGALHAGHAALLDAARRHAGPGGSVVASIFVNPAQFGPAEDFSRYPRTPEADSDLCLRHGTDAVFSPSAGEMYPPGDSTFVEETVLSQGLCGAARPGHFRGVCTVVAKLFQILRPDAAVFGEKDFQQLAVIRRMVRDLFFFVEILAVPTVREPDGLALSSRNRYLTPDERARAARFAAALREAAGADDPAAAARELIARASGCKPEYAELADAETLERPPSPGRPAVLAAAVRIGTTRLIDNVRIAPAHGKV